jgi:hypothetical protein
MKGLVGVAMLLALPVTVAAQPYAGTSAPHKGSFELSVGVFWTGGYDAGGTDATLSPNTTTGGTRLTLFAVTGEVRSTPGVDARAGIFLGRRVSAEGAFQYSRPILHARVTSDFESAPDTDVDGVIASYLAAASLVYHFGDGHLVPYVLGGGGYLRQLHEDNADLLTGSEVHAGGGVKYWLGTGTRRVGIRVEAQGSSRSKSVAFTQKRRIVPSLAAGVSYVF